jgi:ABC-type dipeptide/oligopeptide/nickel transport system permease subunit
VGSVETFPRGGGPRVLAGVTRVVSWPLAAAGVVVGLVLRLLRAPIRLLAGKPAGVRAHARAGARYLGFRSDRYPPLLATVGGDDESPGPWHEARRRMRRSRVALLSWIGVCVFVYLGVAAQAGWIASGYASADRNAVYVEPTWFSGDHPLGTDQNGRDVLALSLRGITTALWIGTVSAFLACLIGTTLGALAGYFGRWVDAVVVWLFTTVESIPHLLLLLAFAFVLKKSPDFVTWYDQTPLATTLDVSVGLFTIVVTLGLTSWVGVCRQVRAEFIRQRERDYVTAARALGLPTRRIVFRQMLPNAFHLVLISFSLLFISTIKYEVILSFLGLGLDVEEASWGAMIGQAQGELTRTPSVWWQLTSATVFMFFLVLCVNLFADTLRDALDPRLKT